MTPERLAEIKDLIKWFERRESIGLSPGTMMPELVEEVDRLQADNARLQAEIDELRRRLDALGSIDWGKVGE